MARRGKTSGRDASMGLLAAAIGIIIVAGCSGEQDFPEYTDATGTPIYTSEGAPSTIFGKGDNNLLDAFGPGDAAANKGGGIGVNSFLWRATLDTVSFMPLSSADPFGGVIITDWYSPPEAPSERFKMNIYILGRQLRADGLKVAVFRQAQSDSGNWVNAAVTSETSTSLENQILTRARQLRVAAATTN